VKKNRRNKIGFFSSLRWKIGITFLITLIVLSFVYLYIAVFTAEMYFQEASQKLNKDIAPHIAAERDYFTNGKANEEELKSVFHNVMIINPSIEVYLLDTKGNILTYYAPNKVVKLKTVPLAPIKEFIKDKREKFILGADPKKIDGEKAFSAAEVYEDSTPRGYIYVILGGEEYEQASQLVFGSYMLRLGVRSMTITLIAAALISLIALTFITRNIRKIIAVIRRFKEGDLKARIKVKGKSELSEFAESFNDMADTIVKNIGEIKTMDNLRRELVANVSHDLRTPLATIQGYIETIMMKSDTLSEEEKKNYMQIIFSSTERLRNLVEELFELSKLEAKESKPTPEPFPITELIQDIQQKNLVIAKQKNLELALDFPYNLPLVYADISMMERVLQNLIDNAFKFTPEGGTVTIGLVRQKDDIQVSISDTGQGIKKEDIPHIFDRYQKAERIYRNDNVGLGLGLAIVKKILEVHNIEIDVQSSIGEGTIFSFSVPVFKIKSPVLQEPVHS
jgi:signal transduction histidine kinase